MYLVNAIGRHKQQEGDPTSSRSDASDRERCHPIGTEVSSETSQVPFQALQPVVNAETGTPLGFVNPVAESDDEGSMISGTPEFQSSQFPV